MSDYLDNMDLPLGAWVQCVSTMLCPSRVTVGASYRVVDNTSGHLIIEGFYYPRLHLNSSARFERMPAGIERALDELREDLINEQTANSQKSIACETGSPECTV